MWLKTDTPPDPAIPESPTLEDSSWACKCEAVILGPSVQTAQQTVQGHWSFLSQHSICHQWPKHQGFPVLCLLQTVLVYSKSVRGAERRLNCSWVLLQDTETQISKCKTGMHWLMKLPSPEGADFSHSWSGDLRQHQQVLFTQFPCPALLISMLLLLLGFRYVVARMLLAALGLHPTELENTLEKACLFPP